MPKLFLHTHFVPPFFAKKIIKNSLCLSLFLCFFFTQNTYAQFFNIKGRAINVETQKTIENVVLTIDSTYWQTQTASDGYFIFENIPLGYYTLRATCVGYKPFERQLHVHNNNLEITIPLQPLTLMAEEVIVRATRLGSNGFENNSTFIKGEALQQQNLATDLPFLLSQTPSAVSTSDAGAGVGYTGIRIRGVDATRINVTINGVPYNDSESQQTYWVNMPDLATSISNLNIQRGVGSSTHGTEALGASVNIQTTKYNLKPYATLQSSMGSFATQKNSLKVGTGMLKSGWSVDARLSKINSNGYIDRASSDLKSYFLATTYAHKNTLVKAIFFEGKEITYQAWEGVPQDSILTNRTFNPYTYPNQVDNYTQKHAQLHISHQISRQWQANFSAHYTKGFGFYEQYKTDQFLPNYSLLDTAFTATADLIRQKWLNNDFIGGIFSLYFVSKNNALQATISATYNNYIGRHYGNVIWASYMAGGAINHQYYNNKGLKNNGNIFAKVLWQASDQWHFFADLQYRHVQHHFTGLHETQGNINGKNFAFNFFNPKVGATFLPNAYHTFYMQMGVANKEPNRNNLLDNAQTPRPETLYDLEIGHTWEQKKYRTNINFYYMYYKNQLVNTGNLNNVGEPIQQNVATSYRTGVELGGAVKIAKNVEWNANATIGKSGIMDFEQTTPIFDNTLNFNYLRDTTLQYKNTQIGFSPQIIAASNVAYTPLKNMLFTWQTKYVSAQFLDNTANSARKLKPYMVNNLLFSYSIFPKKMFQDIVFELQANNIFNTLYENNGYTYFLLFENGQTNVPAQTVNYNFYYPQATVNFLAGLKINF